MKTGQGFKCEEEPDPEPARDKRSGCAKGNLSYSCMEWDTAELRENERGVGDVWKQNGYGKVGWVYVCACVGVCACGNVGVLNVFVREISPKFM